MADKTIFDHKSDSNAEGDEYVSLGTLSGFTPGKVYKLTSAPCGCCTWAFVNDQGFYRTHRDDLPTFEKVEDNVVAMPVPVEPLSFGEMPDDQRGMLLLDKFEGKTIQFYNIFLEAWQDRMYQDDPLTNDNSYRTKPQALIDAENELAAAEARKSELKGEIERLVANL